jgi:integrase
MMNEPRKRGTGSVFQRGDRWWVKFYADGKPQRESATVQRRNGVIEPARTWEEAEKYLEGRLRKVHAHQEDPSKPFITQRIRRLTIDDLLTSLETDFRIRDKDSPPNRAHIKRAKGDFGHLRASELTSDDLNTYVDNRLNPAAGGRPSAKASINRVLEMLGQAYTLAAVPAPKIRCLSEKGNERKGFFGEQQIRAVIANLPADIADFTLFAWLTGMRKGEIEALSWEDVDGDCIRLAALDSKEREARLIPLEGELAELFRRREASRRWMDRDGTVHLASWFFHVDGCRIGDFRKSWATACCAAGVGKFVCPKCCTDVSEKGKCARCGGNWKREDLKYVGRTFHDLRRSACRNMIKAGVPQKTAMAISGHKTDSMFHRYAIVAEDDLRTALRRTQEYLRGTGGDNAVIPMSSERAQYGHSAEEGVWEVIERIGRVGCGGWI